MRNFLTLFPFLTWHQEICRVLIPHIHDNINDHMEEGLNKKGGIQQS
jgi:hypothetical protein